MALLDNIVAHYKFNDDLTDEVNSYTLTGVGSPSYATGKLDNGIDFESSSSQRAYSTNAAYTLFSGTNDFTIAYWMKNESSVLTMSTVNRWHTTNGNKVFGFDVTSGDVLRFYVYTTTSVVINGPTLSDGTWYFVVGRRTTGSNLLELIVNAGTPTTTTLSSSTSIQSVAMATTPFAIGARSDDANHYDGIIDSLSVWDGKSLSNAEIDSLYNSGNGLDYPFGEGGGGGSVVPIIMQQHHARGWR